MSLRKAFLLTAAVSLAVPLGAAGAGSLDQGVPEHPGQGYPGIDQVGDITHVANLGDTTGWSASDLEFATREVTKLSNGATGDPVCVVDAAQPDGCARDAEGNVVYQTEVRDFAVLGGYGQFGRIIDVTDPRNPVHVGTTPCNISQNDIQVSGDLLLVARDGSGENAGTCTRPDGTSASFNGSAVLDFSNPRNPTYLSRLQYTRGSHNHTMHPTKPFVYLSDSDVANAGLGNIPIWNIADPANPVLVKEFKHLAHSPHDITFNADGSRAYAAAVSATYILNTSDPANPTLVATIANEGISISHQSDPTPDGDFLLVTDELGGGAAGLSPGGAVHVYDIRNEATPVKVGLIWDDCVGVSASCQGDPAAEVPVSTAHVFRINPDGYTMAIGWYKDGVHVMDFSSIRGAQAAGSGATTGAAMRTIGRMRMPGANTWSAKMWMERHPGYVFASDIARGFDVFYVASMGPGFLGRGTMHVSHPAQYSAGVGVTRAEFTQDCEYSPRTNGVDGWVAEIPASIADGNHAIKATALRDTGGHDLDVYLFDKDCLEVAVEDTATTDPVLNVPAEARYILVANYTAGGTAIVNLTYQDAIEEEI